MRLISVRERFLESIFPWTVLFFFFCKILELKKFFARAAGLVDPRACCFFGCHQVSAQGKAQRQDRREGGIDQTPRHADKAAPRRKNRRAGASSASQGTISIPTTGERRRAESSRPSGALPFQGTFKGLRQTVGRRGEAARRSESWLQGQRCERRGEKNEAPARPAARGRCSSGSRCHSFPIVRLFPAKLC